METVPVPQVEELKSITVEIGAWDMDADVNKAVSHGLTLTLPSDIKAVSVQIRKDSFAEGYPLDSMDIGGSGVVNGGVVYWSPTEVYLVRTTGAWFDDVDFDLITDDYNRGWITIWYVD